ncbi:NAD(P)-dependent alcohol dehydrogenase [Streptomyces sp. NPDC002553]|uniref:NAD(P)-dependent alcohol dehydrogenase n=1 Tax=unclassified Streptomyces TaxID=2593676 RepID=UPI00331AEA07
MPLTTRAAVVESGGAPFTLCDVVLDDPGPHEAVVRLVAAGLCHTDLGVASGGLPFPLPGVLGHEGAGVVEAVGAAVTRVAPGDHVVLSFTSCGDCRNCHGGHPAYCSAWLPLNLLGGRRADGSSTLGRDGEPLGGHFFGQSSFAERALADERSLVKVDPDVPLTSIAPLGCGVQTGVGAVWNVLQPAAGDTVVVLGAGAVGLSAVMAAALSPATTVVAVDRIAERLRLARELGATHTVDPGSADLAESIAGITGGRGADGVVETTGNVGVLRRGVDALAARGTLVVVGAPPFGTEVALDVNGLLGGKRVVGLTLGDSETQTFIPALVELVKTGRLPLHRLIGTYAFEDIGRAVRDMTEGKTIKPVLTFNRP